MFFVLAKIGWFLVTPSNVILLLLAAGVLGARWRAGRAAGVAGIVLLLACGLGPVGNALIAPLEDRFARPDSAVPPPALVIVLGGGVDDRVSDARFAVELNESGDRVLAAIALARRFPEARILYSGGSAGLVGTPTAEAHLAKRALVDAGIAPDRVLVETESRDTAENARLTLALLAEESGARAARGAPWLVTSAYHMARSVGVFRAAGIEVVAYPVDYRTAGAPDAIRPFSTVGEGLRRTDVAVKEWLGLLAYRLAGRTASLFPAPSASATSPSATTRSR